MAGTLFTADLGDIGATQVGDYEGPSTGVALGGLFVSALQGGANAYADSQRRASAGGLSAKQQMDVEENERLKGYLRRSQELRQARDNGGMPSTQYNALQSKLATEVATDLPKHLDTYLKNNEVVSGFDPVQAQEIQRDQFEIIDDNIAVLMNGSEEERGKVAVWGHMVSGIKDPEERMGAMRELYLNDQVQAARLNKLAKSNDPNAQKAMDGALKVYNLDLFNGMVGDSLLNNPERMKELEQSGQGYRIVEGLRNVRTMLEEQTIKEAYDAGYSISADKVKDVMSPIDSRIKLIEDQLGSNPEESLKRMGADQRAALAALLRDEGLFATGSVSSVTNNAAEMVTSSALSGPEGERLIKLLSEGKLSKFLGPIDMGALGDIDGTARAIRFAFDEIGFNDSYILVKTGVSSARNAKEVSMVSSASAMEAGEKANRAASLVTAYMEESPVTVSSAADVDKLASLAEDIMTKPTDKLTRPELEAKERILANFSARTVAAGERLDQQIDSMQGTRLEGTFVKGTVNNKGRPDLVVSPTSAVGKLLEAQGLPLFASSIEKLAPEVRGRFGEPPADIATVGVTNMAKSMYDGQIKPLVDTYGRFQQYNNKWAVASKGEEKKSGTEPLAPTVESGLDEVQGSNVVDTSFEPVELPAPISEQPGASPNVDAMVEDILVREGGFVNDPDDPGGATNFGITIGTAIENNLDKDGNGVVDVKDVQLITKEDAAKIFKEKYFIKPQIDKLPPELHANVFDMNINAGANSIRILQRLVGVEDDGVIGPDTIAAVQKAAEAQGADQLNIAYAKARREYYAEISRNNPKLKKFLITKSGGKGGWIKRAEEFLPEGEKLSAEGWKEFKASV